MDGLGRGVFEGIKRGTLTGSCVIKDEHCELFLINHVSFCTLVCACALTAKKTGLQIHDCLASVDSASQASMIPCLEARWADPSHLLKTPES